MRAETVLLMELDDLALNQSMLFCSKSSFYFIYVSNLEMLLMLIFQGGFHKLRCWESAYFMLHIVQRLISSHFYLIFAIVYIRGLFELQHAYFGVTI